MGGKSRPILRTALVGAGVRGHTDSPRDSSIASPLYQECLSPPLSVITLLLRSNTSFTCCDRLYNLTLSGAASRLRGNVLPIGRQSRWRRHPLLTRGVARDRRFDLGGRGSAERSMDAVLYFRAERRGSGWIASRSIEELTAIEPWSKFATTSACSVDGAGHRCQRVSDRQSR
jgi:hypothetical protein